MKRSKRTQALAMFFAGWTASETLAHWCLGILGTDLFPISIGRFTFTSTWNAWAMVVWPIALAALLYIAFPAEQPGLDSESSEHAAPA